MPSTVPGEDKKIALLFKHIFEILPTIQFTKDKIKEKNREQNFD